MFTEDQGICDLPKSMFYKAITIQQWCGWVIALLSSIESPHNTQEVCPRATVESDINRGLLPAGPVPPDQLQWKLKLLREILHIPLLSISPFLNDLSWPTIKTPGFSLSDPLHLIPLLNCTENTRRSKWCELQHLKFSQPSRLNDLSIYPN